VIRQFNHLVTVWLVSLSPVCSSVCQCDEHFPHRTIMYNLRLTTYMGITS